MKGSPLLLLFLFFTSCSIFGTSLNNSDSTIMNYNRSIFVYNFSDTAYRVIKVPGNKYGYEILINDKVIIRQQNIPGISGISGFRKRIEAKKIAQLVLKKMQLGIMPPSVDRIELSELKINY